MSVLERIILSCNKRGQLQIEFLQFFLSLMSVYCLQATRVPIPADQFLDIFEDMKDMKVLCGEFHSGDNTLQNNT